MTNSETGVQDVFYASFLPVFLTFAVLDAQPPNLTKRDQKVTLLRRFLRRFSSLLVTF